MVGASLTRAANVSGGGVPISAAHSLDATMRASPTSSLPQQWSPLAWVLTTVSIRPAIGASWSSISRVSSRSNRVSTSREWPSPTTRPALLQPHEPSGCR